MKVAICTMKGFGWVREKKKVQAPKVDFSHNASDVSCGPITRFRAKMV